MSALLTAAEGFKWKCIVLMQSSYNLLYWASGKGAQDFSCLSAALGLMLNPEDMIKSSPSRRVAVAHSYIRLVNIDVALWHTDALRADLGILLTKLQIQQELFRELTV